MINPLLTHRADVYRTVRRDEDGSPVNVSVKIAAIECLYTLPGPTADAVGWSATQQERAAQMGWILAKPDADLKPNDILFFTRPQAMGRLRLSTTGSPVPGPSGISHMRYMAEWVK